MSTGKSLNKHEWWAWKSTYYKRHVEKWKLVGVHETKPKIFSEVPRVNNYFTNTRLTVKETSLLLLLVEFSTGQLII